MKRAPIGLRFKWARFVLFWSLFTLLFSINDFLWKYFTEKVLDPFYPIMIFIVNFINPFQFLVRIKTGLYDFNAMVTFLLIFFFSFILSFLEIRLKGFKIRKIGKSRIKKDERGGI